MTGERRIKQVGQKRSYKLENGLRLTFRVHYKFQDSKSRNHESRQLVAEADISQLGGTDGVTLKTLRDIDDFLLVAGLATRRACICTGWEGYDKNTSVTYYRGDKAISKKKRSDEYYDNLIDYEHQRQFLEYAYPRIVKSPSVEAIRKVIHALLVSEGVLEDIYLRLFSALETLVGAYRKENGLEFIISDEKERDQWKELKNGPLKEWIRSQSLFAGQANSKRRGLLYDKLAGLDRVPFGHAFKEFCTRYKVDLSDLWPISGGKQNLWTLTDIRNKLAHGEPLGSHKVNALGVSVLHIRWTVERMLLAYLDWDITKTDISPEGLSERHSEHGDWQPSQKQISE